jgi:putative ABC transport system permease protein
VSATDVGALGLAASLVLVALAVALSLWQRLGLERGIVWASARALVQLLLVGVALDAVISPGRPLVLSALWIVGMLAFSADVCRRRAPEVPGLFPLALAAFTITAGVAFAVLFGLRIFPVEGRTLVPLAGLLIGNAMTATVLAARRVVEELRDKRLEVEARLALGQTAELAARPYVRSALRTALIPQIETTKAVGIVFLPGAMTGLILAGVSPLKAVVVQAVVMFLVLGSAAVATAVVAVGLRRRLFTRDHRLVPLARPASG